MRRLIAAIAIVSLSGCASFHQGLENEKRAAAADRSGILVGNPNDPVLVAGDVPPAPAAPPVTVTNAAEADAATPPRHRKQKSASSKPDREVLPSGLTGDKQHPAYTDAPQ